MNTYTVDSSIRLEKVESDTEAPKYLLSHNGKRFYIGELVYLIIMKLIRIDDLGVICNELNSQNNVRISREKLSEIIEQSIKPLGVIEGHKTGFQKSRMSYIFGAITLMEEHTIMKVVSPLTFLFNKYIFSIIFAFVTVVHFIFFKDLLLNEIWETRLSDSSDNLWIVGLLYIGFFLILMCHEIGHAAATFSYGVKPQKIGFGFYFLFPVFFTDVSNIWVLGKAKRIMVNIAGIYIQLIVNVIMMGIYHFYRTECYYIFPLIIVNLGVAIYSLNPFFRYDGYWIYSDFFEIPNLKKQSSEYPKRLLKRIKSLFSSQLVVSPKPFWKEIPLLVYSFLNQLFWVYILYFFIGVLISTTRKVGYYYHNWLQGGNVYSLEDTIWFSFRALFMYGVTVFFVARYVVNYFKKGKVQVT
jgi:putative peptide zinc metalloprotease protein